MGLAFSVMLDIVLPLSSLELKHSAMIANFTNPEKLSFTERNLENF